MGFDYSNHQIFAGDGSAESIRDAVVNYILSYSGKRVTCEEDADRSFVVGPPDRWIFVGDSTGSTLYADSEAFTAHAIGFSNIAPTVNIWMSDHAVVGFFLYSKGLLVDQFANGRFPVYRFTSEEESKKYQGDMAKWKAFLVQPGAVDVLRKVWSHDGYATSIVKETGRLFCMHPKLVEAGYTVFDEADEIHYSDWLNTKAIDLNAFDEFHFRSK